MTTKDLINRIAGQTAMTKAQTEDLLSATVSVLQRELLAGKSVALQNLGVLEMTRKNARTIVHPRTGERTAVPEKMRLQFKPQQHLKEMLKNI